jgi:hypothetical protein
MAAKQGLSHYSIESILPASSDVYLGLLTTVPTDRDGTGLVEASGTDYARVATSSWANSTDANGVDYRSSSATLTFPESGGSWGTVVGWAIWDASSGGNLLAFGPVVDSEGDESSLDVVNNTTVRFVSGSLKVGLG